MKNPPKYAHRVCRLIENVLVWRVLRAKTAFTKVLDHGLDIDGFYYLTSEKGVYGIDRSGLYRILRTGGYGIAMRKDRVFLSVDLGCVSKVVEIGFGASPSGLSFAAVRPRGQGFRRRLADRGFPIHRLCASGFGRKRGAPRGASALFRDTAARSVF